MAREHEEDTAGDAVQAFEWLRAEVQVTRRAVEDLPRALQAGLPPQPPDYGSDLGRIMKHVAEVERRLAGIEAQPALARNAESYAATIREAGQAAVAPAVQRLDRAVEEAERTGQKLAAMIGHMRGKEEQRDWVTLLASLAGLVAIVVGLISSPYFAALLPFGWNQQVAAIVMDANRWDAGTKLMRDSNPALATRLADAWNLVDANKSNARAIAACEAAAARTGKVEDCQIVVPPPRR